MSIDQIVAIFAENWGQPGFSLLGYWNSLKEDQSPFVLTALVKVDLQRRFRLGERPAAADYFTLFPDLAADDSRALSLVYEEFCLLEENDERPSVSDFCDRYEPWRDSLVSQLGYHRHFSQVVGAERPKVRYPDVGERFATYELRSILGKGGAAQVYLATDDLGGRQVVLKVSPSIGLEPSILASLEHRNIVPILTVAESPGSGLRGICMPYRPGMTLETMLRNFALAGLPKRAEPVWKLLEVEKLDPETTAEGWRDFPAQGTYTEAVAWLGLAITNALTYLHDRNIYHRDIKPANILLAHRQGPLLFDFNLAHSPNAPEHAQVALLGGTLPYMAPEQLRAFLDPSVWDAVGPSADIYAFGLVLREMVTGLKPDLPNPGLPLSRAIQDLHDRRHEMAASIREVRPDIPPSLEAIIIKCLAFKPVDRYPGAKTLAEDLRRFLERRPLLIAGNSSWIELFVNWTYRRRKIVAGFALILVIFGLTVGTRHPEPGSSPGVRTTEVNPLDPRKSQKEIVVRNPTPTARFDALNDSFFQKGVRFLDSNQPGKLVEALRIFEKLREEQPKSAWPILYLALTQGKLEQSQAAAELIHSEVYHKIDGNEAILQRLKEDPTSVELRVVLGDYYCSKNQFDEARQPIQEALERKPDHPGALALMAEVEKNNNEILKATQYYRRAIEFATKKGLHSYANQVRSIMVPFMLKQVDQILSNVSEDPSRIKASDMLNQIDSEIRLMEVEWKKEKTPGLSRQMACRLATCRGMAQSDWGYFHVLIGQKSQAIAEFQLARNQFEEALKLTDVDPTTNPPKTVKALKELDTHIQNQKNELDRRMKASGFN